MRELDKGQMQLPPSCSLQPLLLLYLFPRTLPFPLPTTLAQLTLAYPSGLGVCGTFSRKSSLIPFPSQSGSGVSHQSLCFCNPSLISVLVHLSLVRLRAQSRAGAQGMFVLRVSE